MFLFDILKEKYCFEHYYSYFTKYIYNTEHSRCEINEKLYIKRKEFKAFYTTITTWSIKNIGFIKPLKTAVSTDNR